MGEKAFYSIKELADLYNKDPSYMGKIIKGSGLDLVAAINGGKACKALSKKDLVKLEKDHPELTVPAINEKEITLDEMAMTLGVDKSGLLKTLKNLGFKLEKRIKEDGGRPTNTLTRTEFEKYTKKHARIVID